MTFISQKIILFFLIIQKKLNSRIKLAYIRNISQNQLEKLKESIINIVISLKSAKSTFFLIFINFTILILFLEFILMSLKMFSHNVTTDFQD